MKIAVVGAGNVGYTVADTLSSIHDVLVIESDDQRSETVNELLNVSVMRGDGTNPKVLHDILEKHEADVIMSTLPEDALNLFVCMMVKRMRPHTRTVARIRDPDFMIRDENGKMIGADQIISPELTTANKLASLSVLENAVDHESLDEMGLVMVTFHVRKEHTNMIGKMVIDLPVPEGCSVVTIYRDSDVIIFNETTELHEGDKICVLGSLDSVAAFNKMMGHAKEAKEIVILGGGIIGLQVAKLLEPHKLYIKIIEKDKERCKKLAKEFGNVLIVNANAVDPHTLRAENVGRADVLICATDSDEKNLLAGLISMEMGTEKVIARYTLPEYEDVFGYTGIRISVGFHLVISNEVTKTMITDEHAILRMKHEGELFFSVMVKDALSGIRVGDLKLPEGARITCIIRNDEKIYPRMDTILRSGDKVLLFTYRTNLSKIEHLFSTEIGS